jgi:hypothetical protein
MTTWSDFVFPEPWWDLRGHADDEDKMRQLLQAELGREVSPHHPLDGETVTALARCTHCDDAVFQVQDGRFACVHLVWSPKQAPPWPKTVLFDSWLGAAEYVERHAVGAGFD